MSFNLNLLQKKMRAPLQQEIVITVNVKTIKFNLIIKKYQISVYIGKFFLFATYLANYPKN